MQRSEILSSLNFQEFHIKQTECSYMHKNFCTYSGGHQKVYMYDSIKQKCQLQMGIAQYKNAATLLRTRGMNKMH